MYIFHAEVIITLCNHKVVFITHAVLQECILVRLKPLKLLRTRPCQRDLLSPRKEHLPHIG